MSSIARYYSVSKFTELKKKISQPIQSAKQHESQLSSSELINEKNDFFHEESTNISSQLTQSIGKLLIKSRSSEDLLSFCQNQITSQAHNLKNSLEIKQKKKQLKRTHSRDQIFVQWIQQYRNKKNDQNASYINQKMNQLQNINNQLYLLKKQIKNNTQNINHHAKKSLLSEKPYYVGDLLYDLQNVSGDQNHLHLTHFKKNFQTFQSISRLNLSKNRINSYHEIIRSKNKIRKDLPTLVLDLDSTLIIVDQSDKIFIRNPIYLPCSFTGKTKKYELKMRPFLGKFLEQTSKMFEIIIFTSKSQEYTKQILTYLDPQKKFISKILSEDYTFCTKGEHEQSLKDLTKVGSDLRRTLYLSSSISSYALQPKNGIPIVPFNEDGEDYELLKLLGYMKKLVAFDNLAIKNDEHFMQSKYCYYFNKNMPTILIAKSLYQ